MLLEENLPKEYCLLHCSLSQLTQTNKALTLKASASISNADFAEKIQLILQPYYFQSKDNQLADETQPVSDSQ